MGPKSYRTSVHIDEEERQAYEKRPHDERLDAAASQRTARMDNKRQGFT